MKATIDPRGAWLFLRVVGVVVSAPGVAGAQASSAAAAPPQSPDSQVRLATRRSVPANVVVADLGVILSGGVTVSYERALTSTFSVLGGFRFQAARAPLLLGVSRLLEDQAGFGIGAEVEFRGYTSGYAPKGFFTGVSVAGLAQSRQSNNVALHLQTALALGYQVVVAARGPVFTFGLGLSFVVLNDWGFDGFYFAPRLAVGSAF